MCEKRTNAEEDTGAGAAPLQIRLAGPGPAAPAGRRQLWRHPADCQFDLGGEVGNYSSSEEANVRLID